MKKVRFQSPLKSTGGMEESECHSPRPFILTQAPSVAPDLCHYQRVLPFSADPVERYETSDSSPYPVASKTKLPNICDPKSDWLPSNNLDLSMLDSLNQHSHSKHHSPSTVTRDNKQVLNSVGNAPVTPPNVLTKDNSFFIKRDNLKFGDDAYTLQNQLARLSLGKENYPKAKKSEDMTLGVPNLSSKLSNEVHTPLSPLESNNDISDCSCHHCLRVQWKSIPHCDFKCSLQNINSTRQNKLSQCHCIPSPNNYNHIKSFVNYRPNIPQYHTLCHCINADDFPKPQNAVDKKTWAIEKYEQSKKEECMDVETQNCKVKEKREPTVADLFKIIKLQNEQLQLLQEKVDKFISANNNGTQTVQPLPIQNCVTEHVALQTINSAEHKISIGVMTSFEMVRTSTVINKEIVKQTHQNAQIQCNRSQISVKEVVSQVQPVNLNFLDGIVPVGTTLQPDVHTSIHDGECVSTNAAQQYDFANEEKTLNELSLYNVQVDNATTPLISPDQSLYLDVRDYSDSEDSDDPSNVGWTYYNKVMTHVNGLLQDSDMPSSASALYRNTRQQCMQMQIDKTNLSVAKRVKFGDDPLADHKQHINAASTDTSIKMNQLAAKYLKNTPLIPQQLVTRPAAVPTDMSLATRNYMERHKLLRGLPTTSGPPPGEMPKFLDITALKQQPKFL